MTGCGYGAAPRPRLGPIGLLPWLARIEAQPKSPDKGTAYGARPLDSNQECQTYRAML
ncbi:hypothetical protein GCM10009670_10140 [Citricoccus alkalitolerans]